MPTSTNRQNIVNSFNHPSKQFWFILYTCPRSEKIVYKELELREIDVFLPCLKVEKIWKNRQRKITEQVLFPGYIFVKTSEQILHNLIRLPKIVSFVGTDNKPSIIRQNEIDCINMMLIEDTNIIIENMLANKGDEVKVLSGPFSGYEGIIIRRQGKTLFGIELTEIKKVVFIDITSNKVQMINQKNKQ